MKEKVASTTFGRNVRRVRRAKDITQKELAEICGMTENAIHLIERTNRTPTLETARLIAKALETTIDELLK